MENTTDQINELFEYLITDKKALEQKYEKLLDLHNNLIENNSVREEKYSAQYIYKLADENEFLRSELGRVLSQNSALTGKPLKTIAEDTEEPEKMHERLEVLEKKLTELETKKTVRPEPKSRGSDRFGFKRRSKPTITY